MSKINLSTIDTDIGQDWSRTIQTAFDHGIDCDIIQGGLVSGGSEQDVFSESSTKNYDLGSIRKFKDGRVFVYCKNGSTGLTVGTMCQAPAPTSDWTENAQTSYGFDAGDTTGNIVISGTDPGSDGWKDGYMVQNKGTNLGQFYKITTNDAGASNPAVTLETAVVSDIGASAEISVVVNPFGGSIVVPAGALTAQTVGVPLIDVTSSYYYWSQVRGPAPLLVDTDETVVIGECVGIPATAAVDGACGVHVATDEIWGRVMFVAAADEVAIVDLSVM